MKIIYDARHIYLQYTGLGRFSGNLLLNLINNSKTGDFFIVILPPLEKLASNSYFSALVDIKPTKVKLIYSPIGPFEFFLDFRIACLVNSINADIFIHPHFNLPVGIKTKTACVIHDLLPLIIDGYIQNYKFFKKIYFYITLKYILKKCDFLFFVSKNTKKDFIRHIGKSEMKMHVIYQGNSLEYELFKKSKLNIKKNFILYVGDRRPHKNIKRIIDLFSALKKEKYYNGDLFMVGSTVNFGWDLEKYISSRNDIKAFGFTNDEDLDYLYKKCDALILISLYEGFGIPIVDSMRYKKKLIVSNGGALDEISPFWAYKIPNEDDPNEHIKKIGKYLNSDLVKTSDLPIEFDWKKIALSFLNKISIVESKNDQY
jgi:glycosyltransferase involved in cell wall biosynthesis